METTFNLDVQLTNQPQLRDSIQTILKARLDWRSFS